VNGLANVILSCLAVSFAQAQTTAFAGGTLVDGTGSPPISNAVVIVTDSLIACAGTKIACAPHMERAGRRVLDISGKWIIPGLIDVHLHLTSPQLPDPVDQRLLALLRAGITTVRDVGAFADSNWRATQHDVGNGEVERIAELAQSIGRGGRLGPRILYCGPGLTSRDRPFPPDPNYRPIGIPLHSSARVDDVVSYLISRGASCIKLYSSSGSASNPLATSSRHMREVLEAAAAHGVPGIGHSSERVPLDTQRTWAWREIHHLYIPVEDLLPPDRRARLPANPWARNEISIARFDPAAPQAAALAAKVAQRGIAWVPTLTVTRGPCRAGCWEILRSVAFDDSAAIREALFDAASPPQTLRDSIEATRSAHLRFANAWVSLLHSSGVRILAGSDAPAGGPLGSELHAELEYLVAAGLNPAEALAAATRNAANALGQMHRIGTISPGKLADLVVLDADPLADIRNIRAIRHVMLGGALLNLGSGPGGAGHGR
jgi:imidazolonepropionase-like amidohydrolase